MFDDKGVLTDRARGILFWFTIAMIVVVAVGAIATILRACSGLLAQVETPLALSPGEVSLCPGEQQQFGIAGDVEVTWAATGGLISESGFFTAGDVLGDYTVTATATDSRRTAEATVHVIACAPTPMPTLPPTAAPTATPTPEPGVIPPADAQGDVGAYDSGAPVAGAPGGVDISAASIAPDLRVTLQPAEVPGALTGWAAPGEIVLWIALYEPIPNPPTTYTDWIFALDVDGSTATGRAPGSVRINPDLGDDAVVGVSYNTSSGEYEPYFYVWSTAQGQLIAGTGTVRYFIDSTRTLIALALPLDAFTQSVAQGSGATVMPEAVKGRAAVVSYVGEQRVIDFYPDRPQ
jgi:hypothetical protein